MGKLKLPREMRLAYLERLAWRRSIRLQTWSAMSRHYHIVVALDKERLYAGKG